jgi:hypothetical protein
MGMRGRNSIRYFSGNLSAFPSSSFPIFPLSPFPLLHNCGCFRRLKSYMFRKKHWTVIARTILTGTVRADCVRNCYGIPLPCREPARYRRTS